MTEEKKKKGLLDSLDNLTSQDWRDVAETVDKAEKSSDEWLKHLIEKGEKKRGGSDPDDKSGSAPALQ